MRERQGGNPIGKALVRASQLIFPYLTDGGSTTWSIKDNSLLIPFKTKLHVY